VAYLLLVLALNIFICSRRSQFDRLEFGSHVVGNVISVSRFPLL
jgi:hypothetical protein